MGKGGGGGGGVMEFNTMLCRSWLIRVMAICVQVFIVKR